MSAPVTMIGLGPMGQAMVRRFLEAGHRVTVWNRTASRADEVVAAGAVRAATPAEAVAAGGPVVLSLTDYQAMYDILGDAGEALRGRVVVNLSSDTPERTREAAEWFAARGARMLTGGIMVPAVLVGSESAYVFYSGPREVFDEHLPLLRLIGRPDHLGDDPRLAQLFYQAQLAYLLTALAGFAQAAAIVGTAGVTAAAYLPYAVDVADSMSMYLGQAAKQIDAGEHPGTGDTTMMRASAAHIAGTSRDSGLDTAVPDAVLSLYDRAVAAGRGAESWTVLSEVVRGRLA